MIPSGNWKKKVITIMLLSPSVRITARDGGKLLNAAKEVVFLNFQLESLVGPTFSLGSVLWSPQGFWRAFNWPPQPPPGFLGSPSEQNPENSFHWNCNNSTVVLLSVLVVSTCPFYTAIIIYFEEPRISSPFEEQWWLFPFLKQWSASSFVQSFVSSALSPRPRNNDSFLL